MQQLLPTFEPTEADLVEMALAVPLDEKIENATKTLKYWEPDEGYYLAFSGGKDSQCIYELAKMAGVDFEAHYNVTSLDPPELVRFIRSEYPDVVWNRQPIALLTRLVERSNGPPTRLARWCCNEYKEQGGIGRTKIIGVRVAESARRKALWKTVVPHRTSGTTICPIVYWTDADVWAFHAMRDIPHCELYDQGFTRLGCIGCPLGGPKSQRREFDRWPRYEMLWKRAVRRYYEAWEGVPRLDGGKRYVEGFVSWEDMWDWWISGVRKDDSDDGCQMEFMWS